MLERYYSINDAAEFLSKETVGKVTERGILDMIRRKELRLCLHVTGSSEICLFNPDDDPPLKPYLIDTYFDGYIQIPETAIMFHSIDQEILLKEAKIIEIIDSFEQRHNLPEPNLLNYLVRKVENFNKDNGETTYGHYKVNFPDALIPTEDLLSCKTGNKKGNRVQAEKPLSTMERNTLLTIIGLMAKDGYRNDLSQPYLFAKELKKVAELLGIAISDDTIANKLKEAKNILAEKAY